MGRHHHTNAHVNPFGLSDREIAVMQCVLDYDGDEAATCEELEIKPGTLKTYLQGIAHRLKLVSKTARNSRTRLLMKALREGIISL